MVLYRNQWPVNFISHSAELHIGSSIRYENALYGNIFLNCNIVKIIFNILQLFFLVYINFVPKSVRRPSVTFLVIVSSPKSLELLTSNFAYV